MADRLVGISFLAIICGAALGQSPPKFTIADAHVSAPTISYRERSMTGGLASSGRYELRRATMLDLIVTAWGVEAEKVLGGPGWLDMDRFDIRAMAPARTSQVTVRQMLQALLTDRFGLAIHKDTKPVPGYALLAGKTSRLKVTSGAGNSGCTADMQNRTAGAENPANPTVTYTCHNMTMAAFAVEIANLPAAGDYIGSGVVADQTGLQGAWDFSFNYTVRSAVTVAGLQVTTLADAMDKQLGLKLEPAMVTSDVIVVDSVNRTPSANPPGLDAEFPVLPIEFEVADVKPSAPGANGTKFRFLPGGRVDIQATMKNMIKAIWGLNDVMIAGMPQFADTDYWDIVAKAPPAAEINSGEADVDTLVLMLKTLIEKRFGLTVHMEDRPIQAYTLVAVKPKLKKSDPSVRTGCKEGPATLTKTDARDANPMLGRLLTCQNTSMSQFAYLLFHGMVSGYVKSPVLDATGLEGGWDFTLNFSAPGQIQTADGGAADPTGTVPLPEAMEKQIGIRMEFQKRPEKILVIDHLERQPTEN